MLLAIGRKRGCLISGGEVDSERVANLVIDEYRSAKIGRISLDGRLNIVEDTNA